MKRQSKWLDANPQRAAARVARACLRDRLRWVWRMLRFSAEADCKRPEAVHQLRVATRRATTVIALLRDYFPAKKIRWIEKRLKKLRRAAGKARDLDVLALHYHSLAKTTREIGKFENYMNGLRHDARRPIQKIFGKLTKRKVNRHIGEALQKPGKQATVAADQETSFGEYSHARLSTLWCGYIRTAELDLGNIEQLHQFRIATKEFRYALELFGVAISADDRNAFYNRIIALQDAMGMVNDHAVAIQLLQKVIARMRKRAIVEWLNDEIPRREQELVEAHQNFLRDWPAQHEELLTAWKQLFAPSYGAAACSKLEDVPLENKLSPTQAAQAQNNNAKYVEQVNGNGHKNAPTQLSGQAHA